MIPLFGKKDGRTTAPKELMANRAARPTPQCHRRQSPCPTNTQHTPMTYEYDAQEIKAPAFLADPKVLAYLEGTDADIDRLVLEEDNKLWAYSKRTPDDLCRSSLEDMVAVAFPSYFMAAVVPVAVAVPVAAPAVRPPAPAKPKTPKVATLDLKTLRAMKPMKTPASRLAPMRIPVTGAARGLLASGLTGNGHPPSVMVNGVRHMVPKPLIEGDHIKVALRDTKGVLVGCAVLSTADYTMLTDTPAIKADTMLWTLNPDGEVTTRVRGNPQVIEVRAVNDLLIGIRSESRVAVVRQTWA